MSNPLLSDWTGAFGLAPFAEISDADFAPAFETALAEDLAETLEIANDPQIPSFANTIEALAATGKALHQVLSVFYTLSGADSNESFPPNSPRIVPKFMQIRRCSAGLIGFGTAAPN